MSQKATTDVLNTKQATITNSNKLSADLVTDTTTTNKFVTAEDKTTWNAKQNALTAGDNITISGDTISTPAIAPEVVAELPATGEESKLYLTPKAHTTQTATGNPITATVTEEAGALESFQLDGDTYQQTYTGKNLLSAPDYTQTSGSITCVTSDDNKFTVNGTVTESWGFAFINNRTEIEPIPAGSYTLSLSKALAYPVSFQLRAASSGNPLIGTKTINAGSTSETFTLSEAANIFTFWSTASRNTQINDTFTVQIEHGSTATSYEPYVGGTPSPNPDYPQPIQTVTGLQTITINGTDYPLDLGDIQLCGLGDDGNGNPLYKDRIYRDGDGWKVHKDIGKYQFNGSEPWVRSGSTTSDVFVAVIALTLQDYLKVKDRTTLKSPYFIQHNPVATASGQMDAYNAPATAPVSFGLSFDATSITSITDATTWITNNKPTVYSAINNPTDTVITDQTLIAQLEAIRTASLQNGTNTITNTATGSNLAGDMEIEYYGYNPRNRYDKWLWLDINNEYEQIGS
jgi:hypothetical protein